MWRLRDEIGCLDEHERRPYLDAAGMIADELFEEMSGAKQTFYGIRHFDYRNRGQRLRLLADAVSALVDRDVPPPVPTACLDGTVIAILNRVLEMVGEEVESELRDQSDPDLDIYSWRRSVRAALKPALTATIKFQSVDMVDWVRANDELRGRVLGDRRPISDVTPASLEYRAVLRVTDQERENDRYYATFPIAPDVEEIPRLWRRLRALTHVDFDLPLPTPQRVPRPCFLIGDAGVSRQLRNN